MTLNIAEQAPEVMQCMEVWGGNHASENAIVSSGLRLWVYCKPHAHSVGGGDIYYVSSCATGRITRLVVADVSGHGDAVAGVAIALRRLMRQYVNFLDQTQFIESMNQQFAKLSKESCFATAVVATFFSTNGHLSLSNAGHPPPLLYSAVTKSWKAVCGTATGNTSIANIPLGIDHSCTYAELEIALNVDDLVLCYTDSLIEARVADGGMLGVDGLLEVARSVAATHPANFVQSLLDAILRLAPGNLDDDDVTVLLFSPNGSGRRMTFRQQVFAPIRLCRGLISALRSREQLPRPDFSLANFGGAIIPSLGRGWRGRSRGANKPSVTA